MESLPDRLEGDLEILVDIYNGRMVPDTEILAVAQSMPDAFNYLKARCGWDNRIESDTYLAAQIDEALAEASLESSDAA